MAYRLKKRNIVLAILLIAAIFFYPKLKETWQTSSTPTQLDPSADSIPEAIPTDTLVNNNNINITLKDSTHIAVQHTQSGNIKVNGKEIDNVKDLPKAIEDLMKNIPEKDRPEALKDIAKQYIEQTMKNSSDSIHLSKENAEQIDKFLKKMFDNILTDTLE